VVRDYNGRTFVAFLDILGFRNMVKNNISLAAQTLDKFYEIMYDECLNLTRRSATTHSSGMRDSIVLPEVNMIVASDCAVIFARNTESGENISNDLECISAFIRTVNSRLIRSDSSPSILTTCSIAYGQFIYEDRRESNYLRKNCFLGTPYMEAFSDNEKMKTEPGLCRLLRDNMPANNRISIPFFIEKDGYYYFYWMLRDIGSLGGFLKDYEKARQAIGRTRYKQLKEVLQRYCNIVQQ
jgi:hypothetical protein